MLSKTDYDAGGSKKWPLLPGVHGEAFISDCKRYRHWLSRSWGPAPLRYVLFIGLNPSQARKDVDDPTIRKEINFAKAWGYNAIFKANICDFASTDWKRLLNDDVNPCSEDNWPTIRKLAGRSSKVVLCYGAIDPKLQPYADRVVKGIRHTGKKVFCLGLSKQGLPLHPLYLSLKVPLMEFKDG